MTRDVLTKLIEKHQQCIKDDVRDYIGASSIGSDCLRQIWYQYKGIEGEEIPPKFRRAWDIGKNLEGLVLDWLEYCGLEISRLWSGLQSDKVPHFRGHLDAVWTKMGRTVAILEIKTAKDSSFKIFVSKGLKVWNEQYYAQIQSYMGMSGIFSAYILVLNKDNSDLSDEFVEFDEQYYKGLEARALMISIAVVEPPRINGSPLFYKCKMCKFNKVCHG